MEQQQKAQLFISRILAGALMATTLVYVFIAYLRSRPENLAEEIGDALGVGGSPWQTPMLVPFAICSLVSLVLSFLLPKLMENAAKKANQKASPVIGIILRFALLESITIYGLILSFQANSFEIILPFACLSFLMMTVFFPRRDASI